MAKSFLNISGYPLGLRNNNPGNLRTSADRWLGKIGDNQGFVVFENIAYGTRALGIDLRTKMRNGYDTIEAIITRYAPPSENDTAGYISFVSGSTGFGKLQPLNPDIATLLKLERAIINFENGSHYGALVTDRDIMEGLEIIEGLETGPDNVTGWAGIGVGSLLLIGAVILVLTMPKTK